MSPFSFTRNITLALALALIGTGAYAVLSITLTEPAAFNMTVALLAAVYGGALLFKASEHAGRLLVPFVWLLATAAGASLLGSSAFLILQVGMVWLVRSLYFHDGPINAALDLGVTVCAFGAAIWAAGTGSWFMMIWTFFLVQSMAALIPNRSQRSSSTDNDEQRFDRARLQALAALKKLATY